VIARELIRTAVGRVFSKHFSDVNFQPVIQWFELGGELKFADLATAEDRYEQLANIKDLVSHVNRLGVTDMKNRGGVAAAAELILEGLWAHSRIGRSEERGFYADKTKPHEHRAKHHHNPHREYNRAMRMRWLGGNAEGSSQTFPGARLLRAGLRSRRTSAEHSPQQQPTRYAP